MWGLYLKDHWSKHARVKGKGAKAISWVLPVENHQTWQKHLQLSLWQASLVTQMVKNSPAVRETWIWCLGWEDPMEEDIATHSSILAWRIPMERRAWWATVHRVTKSQMWLTKHSTIQAWASQTLPLYRQINWDPDNKGMDPNTHWIIAVGSRSEPLDSMSSC